MYYTKCFLLSYVGIHVLFTQRYRVAFKSLPVITGLPLKWNW